MSKTGVNIRVFYLYYYFHAIFYIYHIYLFYIYHIYLYIFADVDNKDNSV